MKHLIFLLTTFFIFCCFLTNAQNTQDIKQTLSDWNMAIMNKDVEKASNIFDRNANVILAGSGKEELYKGNAEIRKFLERLLANPFTVSWDMSNVSIDQNKKTAWAFVNGTVTIKQDSGSIVNMPYRITVVMIKKGKVWKWRLLNGSVPKE